jgi:hypothetical protein
MPGRLILLAVAAIAATVPVADRGPRSVARQEFPGWPRSFEGRALAALPLGERETEFETGFPGRIGRFTDGTREIVVRWVCEATRSLHPAADCYEYSGFEVAPAPVHVDAAGERWSAFEAKRGAERFRVHERLTDDRGKSWTDVSAWYWSALLSPGSGPWWAWTWVERMPN